MLAPAKVLRISIRVSSDNLFSMERGCDPFKWSLNLHACSSRRPLLNHRQARLIGLTVMVRNNWGSDHLARQTTRGSSSLQTTVNWHLGGLSLPSSAKLLALKPLTSYDILVTNRCIYVLFQFLLQMVVDGCSTGMSCLESFWGSFISHELTLLGCHTLKWTVFRVIARQSVKDGCAHPW